MIDTPKEAATGDKAARDLMLSELLQMCTPAPWTTLPIELEKPYIRIRGAVLGGRYKIANIANEKLYCGVPAIEKREEAESVSNAKLIALAPTIAAELIKERAVNAKLLEALKSCFDYPSDTFDINAEANFSMTVSGFHLHQVADAIKQAEEL
jgi:hypothetical protein